MHAAADARPAGPGLRGATVYPITISQEAHVANAPARSAQQRKRDTLARLDREVDAWVASASPEGFPYLIPLSYLWDGQTLTVSTPEDSPTARNLSTGRPVRLTIGPTRDVVLIEGTAEAFSSEKVPAELADAFADKLWDPRLDSVRYSYFRITPRLIQAWREVNELSGRTLMRDGRWLA
jgi:nitroimidazol reductase NimA-like FMN-containing flavoprotein (pyridoxamine 5'-phosphate oxidase superfamily)